MHVSSPKGKIIKPGDSIVLRGEGMPHRGNPDQKGQLYVILEVDMPDEGWLASIDQKACDFPSLFFLLLLSRTLILMPFLTQP